MSSEDPIEARYRVNRELRDYPIGVTAHSHEGFAWVKQANGWRARGGSVFPGPGLTSYVTYPPGYVEKLYRCIGYPSDVVMDGFREGVREGDAPRLERLIANYGADVFRKRGNPVCAAVSSGQPEMIRFLAGRGFDLDRGEEFFSTIDRSPKGDPRPPLMRAIRRRDEECVVTLLELGANANIICPSDGITPSQLAIDMKQTRLLHLIEVAALKQRALGVIDELRSEMNASFKAGV